MLPARVNIPCLTLKHPLPVINEIPFYANVLSVEKQIYGCFERQAFVVQKDSRETGIFVESHPFK